MKRSTPGLARALAVPLMALAVSVPTTLQAQSAFLGVGPTFPTGDFGDYANPGFMLVGGLTFDVGEQGLAVVAEGFWGQNNHDDEVFSIDGGKTQPLGVMGGLLYDFSGDEAAGVYIFGEAGLMWHRYVPAEGDSQSESGFGFGAGAGYGFPLGSIGAWAEGRFMSASIEDETTSFFAIVFGLSFPFGANGDGM